MIRFRWVEWNLAKIEAHGLSPEEVEHAFHHRMGSHQEREDGSYETVGPTPSGRVILIAWRYNEEFDALEEECMVQAVFVITAF